ncbi:hypothetical protein CMUS01_14317 [Colletotrichum musicola]|uniref:Uncharacterized protein n=1 Tax=Colletotrichum musicola TaxID=2175873 RepID=A0A8H6J578_9PEZI|nr:hypothetical protein CMUS01_14317 [Colletotrichum musicola]
MLLVVQLIHNVGVTSEKPGKMKSLDPLLAMSSVPRVSTLRDPHSPMRVTVEPRFDDSSSPLPPGEMFGCKPYSTGIAPLQRKRLRRRRIAPVAASDVGCRDSISD